MKKLIRELLDVVREMEVCIMDTSLSVAMALKDSTFQVRINSEIKKAVEDIKWFNI